MMNQFRALPLRAANLNHHREPPRFLSSVAHRTVPHPAASNRRPAPGTPRPALTGTRLLITHLHTAPGGHPLIQRLLLAAMILFGLGEALLPIAVQAKKPHHTPESKTPVHSAPPVYAGVLQRVAILPLQWHCQAPASFESGFEAMLTNALVNSGRFVVVDRKNLKHLLDEQTLGASGAVSAQTAAKLGRIIGAQFMIDCAVNDYVNKGGTVGGRRVLGIQIGGKSAEATVGMVVRLVDSSSGEIVVSQPVEGHVRSAGAAFNFSQSNFSMENDSFKNSPIGRASQKAIDNAVAAISQVSGQGAWEGRVADVDNRAGDVTAIYVNAGTHAGLKIGDELEVFRPGGLINDPDSGKLIGRKKGQTIGRCRITSITQTLATATPTRGSGFRKDDHVRLCTPSSDGK